MPQAMCWTHTTSRRGIREANAALERAGRGERIDQAKPSRAARLRGGAIFLRNHPDR